MKKELSAKQIFDDFVSKTILTEREKEVLIRYVKGESIVKIAEQTSQSTTTICNIVSQLKKKYQNYRKLEVAKLLLFQQ